MISYYELLQMIKDGNIPEKIKVSLNGLDSTEYKADYDYDNFNGYELSNSNDRDENYRYFLSECFLESDMFDKCIEIVEKSNNIEKLDINKMLQTKKWKRDKKSWEKINEIIDKISELEK